MHDSVSSICLLSQQYERAQRRLAPANARNAKVSLPIPADAAGSTSAG
jgi:hypothetical protein